MTGSNSRTLWRLTKGFRYRYALAIGALIIGTVFGYLPALVSRATVDAIVGSPGTTEVSRSAFWPDHPGGAATLRDRLWLAAILIATFAFAGALFMHLKDRWTALAAEGVIRRLRDRLYDHLQRLPCHYHDQAETGDLVQRCTSDVETVHNFLSLQVVEIGRALLLLATVIPIMLLLDGRMTAVSLAGTPLIVAFSTVFFLKIKPAFLQMDEAEGRMTTVLQENLTGIRVVRAFARQEHECAKFAQRNRDFRDRNYHLIMLVSIFWPLSDLLVFGQLAAVLLTGAYWVGVGQLSVGTTGRLCLDGRHLHLADPHAGPHSDRLGQSPGFSGAHQRDPVRRAGGRPCGNRGGRSAQHLAGQGRLLPHHLRLRSEDARAA